MRIDLHAHSTASDGTDSPAQLVRAAHEAGLDVVAITDHDTDRGWDEAAAVAREVGVTLVRGIEISCLRAGTSVHLLAYLPDPCHPALVEELARSRESRVGRLERMVAAMVADDLPISMADVAERVEPGATLGRPHLADALVACGVVADRDEAFARLLHDNGPYYVAHYAPDPVRAVEVTVAAGGVPVIAHPYAVVRGRVVTDDVIEEMVHAGLAGLEAHHRENVHAGVERALALARRHDLLVTGASDYHGHGKVNRLGENTTDPGVFEDIVAAATSGVEVVRP